MKSTSLLLGFLLILSSITIAQDMQTKVSDAQSIHDFTMTTIDGKEQSLSDYKGKVVLIVNVASKCGLTPQYKDLQALYASHKDKGLVILGFPANNFMGQEPGTNEQIATFCERNYGVEFPMFSKISVKGKDTHPLYSYLKQETGETPGWNFHKYLVDKDGKVIRSISARTKVDQSDVMTAIEELL